MLVLPSALAIAAIAALVYEALWHRDPVAVVLAALTLLAATARAALTFRENLRMLSEQTLTNALERLAYSGESWIVFLEGHGERNTAGDARHQRKQAPLGRSRKNEPPGEHEHSVYKSLQQSLQRNTGRKSTRMQN